MNRRLLPLLPLTVTALAAACTPLDPTAPSPSTAVAAGVSVGSNGVQPSASVVRTSGNVTVGIGLGN